MRCSWLGWLLLPPLLLAQPADQKEPQLNTLRPFGAQRGQKVEVTLNGTNRNGLLGLWSPTFSALGQLRGEFDTQDTVRLSVPERVPLGLHGVRMVTRSGISSFRLFCVDDLPEVSTSAEARDRSKPQLLKPPCVVSGQIDPEVSHYFRFAVQKGESLNIEVVGRRLGNGLDPFIRLYDGKTAQELPGLYSDDAPGLAGDPRLVHTFQQAGDVLLEVRDSTYRGKGDFLYRLRIGNFPCATLAMPAAIPRGKTTTVTFVGPDVLLVPPTRVTAPDDPLALSVAVAPRRAKNRDGWPLDGPHGWPILLRLSDHPELVEQEPNDSADQAQKLAVPCGVTGQFLAKGDRDFYRFDGQKGRKLVFQAETLEIGSPATVYFVVQDARGTTLAKSNPEQGDRLEFTPAADGEYIVIVEHQNFLFGPLEAYRLTVRPSEPDLEVQLGTDKCVLSPGGQVVLPINAVIRKDFSGPVEVSVAGSKGVSGQVTIAPNVGPASTPPKAIASLTLKAEPTVNVGPWPLRLQATATVNGKKIIRPVTFKGTMTGVFTHPNLLPPDLFTQLGFVIIQPPSP